MSLKAPFPYFGGKSTVASIIWDRLGDVQNYVEPFAGSLAVLLARPHAPKTETVNDINCYLTNFWRAVQADPEAVAKWANWPVSELDLIARHKWLRDQAETLERMKTDPEWYDAKIAGWWVWGACSWIGSGWCEVDAEQLPHLGNAGQGINRKLPHLGDAGQGIAGYMLALSDRLRRVRIACGDWKRVLGPSVTFKHGLTGILLDPPYDADADGAPEIYGQTENVAPAVWQWAIENGDNPLLRIAVCGFDDGRTLPSGWTAHPWKRRGGFGAQSNKRGRANAEREVIWFSPYCIATDDLFSYAEQAS